MAESSYVHRHSVFEQLQAIRANDEKALRQLYVSNYHKIESFILKNSGTEEQAKDVYQEAFIALWRNIQLERFQPQNDTALDGYLYQIARNKWMDHLRSGHFNKVVSMDTADMHLPDDGGNASDTNALLDAIRLHFKLLGDNCRKVLTLFYYDNDSMKKIADEMGWTEATARNNKYRCIQKLRELLNKK